MSRAGLAPGDIGEVAYEVKRSGVVAAKVRYRRHDGTLARLSRTGPNKSAARRIVMQAVRERMSDIEPDPGVHLTRDSTMADLAEAYLAVQAERNVGNSPQYLSDEVLVARRFIIGAEFGAVTIRALRASAITAEHRRLGVTLSLTGRARQWLTLVGKLCAYAVELDLMAANPHKALSIKRIKGPKKKAAPAQAVEDLRVVARAYAERPNRMGPKPSPLLLDVADVVAGTGLRIGEILVLRWMDDVHLHVAEPVIFVRGTVVEGHGIKKHRQPYPKSSMSERGILIPPFLVETLQRRRDESLGVHWLVFETSGKDEEGRGRPVGPQEVRIQLAKVRKWALTQPGLPDIDTELTMHALRRGVATQVSDDHDIVVAARTLGNAQSQVTETQYVERNRIAPDTRQSLQAYGRPGE